MIHQLISHASHITDQILGTAFQEQGECNQEIALDDIQVTLQSIFGLVSISFADVDRLIQGLNEKEGCGHALGQQLMQQFMTSQWNTTEVSFLGSGSGDRKLWF